MDNSNNSSNFPASPTTNDINAANQTAQNPSPVPTWLPPQPGTAPAAAPNPFNGTPPPPTTTTPTPEPTAWPSAPQDHGSSSPSNGWNPPSATSTFDAAQPAAMIPQPLSPMDSGNTFGNGALSSQPATSSPGWTPPPSDQGLPIPPGTSTASPVSTTPSWSPPTSPTQAEIPTTPAPIQSEPAWTPPTTSTFGASPSPVAPVSSSLPPSNVPIESSVFPPQFQNTSTPANLPSDNHAPSFDPLASTVTPSASAWPTPQADLTGSPSTSGFATPQPSFGQNPSPASTAPAFIPSLENSPGVGGSTATETSTPTVPDFINNLNNQPPATNMTQGAGSSFGSTPAPDTNPTDLSEMGNPSNNPVYTPTVGGQESSAAAVTPSGIPETVANVNKPKLSKMVIIIGVVAILMVIASASYLLFFNTKPGTPEDTISLPVTNQAPLTKPKVVATPVAASSSAPVVATSSASPTASASATSAFDLLKQAKSSPSPAASPK